jgi:hypothetical protein
LSNTDPPSDSGNVGDNASHQKSDQAVVTAAGKAAAVATQRLRKPRQRRNSRKDATGFWANFWGGMGSNNQILGIVVIGLVICMLAGAVAAVVRSDLDFFIGVMKTVGALLSPIIAFAIGRSTGRNRAGE